MQRMISLDVCNYTGNTLCSLYDSSNQMDGQATNVFIHTERNGFKELSFDLPSACEAERNYRLDYLVSDYRIRLRDVQPNKTEIDWFLISESKVTHNAFSTNYSIRASHISNLLNTKNLSLEFSDEEGNNTGTIRQIAETILEGTGWHLNEVATFYEEDKFARGERIEKVRSFNASVRTGAFKMMSDLCELFDAKPIYHGEGTYTEDGQTKTGRTVDILPLNPFSEKLDEGVVPPDLDKSKIIELYYDKNIHNVTRTLNTENLVTVFTAYGSYGDLNGEASLPNAEHAVLTFDSLDTGEYCFAYQDVNYYFTVDTSTTNLKWSSLDYLSRSYVYNGTVLYKVYKTPQTATYVTITPDATEYEKNRLPYIMDFSYYQKIGMFTDEMLLALAEFQTTMPEQYIASQQASLDLSDIKTELSNTASAGNGFVMLDISSSVLEDGHTKLTLKKSTYPDGVIYRSDYDEAKRNYFTWYTATGIKTSGEAIAGRGAVVYIVRQGNPTKWDKSYVKEIGNTTDNYYRDSLNNLYQLHTKEHHRHKDYVEEPDPDCFPDPGTENVVYVADDTNKLYIWKDEEYVEIQASAYYYGLNEFPEPDTITLWDTNDTWQQGDKVYLFSADSIAGVFGPREDAIMANKKSIEEATKVSTETHPLYFIENNQAAPSTQECNGGYGWYYRSYTDTFNFGDLYFCWNKNGDLDWWQVYVSNSDENPELIDLPAYRYYYSTKRMMLYFLDGATYRPVNKSVDEEKITNAFAAVIEGCYNQEVLTKGVCEAYTYSGSEQSISIGNYAFKNEYNNYWLFTTRMNITDVSKMKYVPSTKVLWQTDDDNQIVKAVEHSFRYLDFPKEDELYETIFTEGKYENHAFSPEGDQYISNNIYVHDNVVYEFSLPPNSTVVCLTKYQDVLNEFTSSPFTTPNNTTHIRVVCNTLPTDAHYLRVKDYDKTVFSKNIKYTILPCVGSGDRLGITNLMDKFIDLAHEAYEVKLPALQAAQQAIEDAKLEIADLLGDMYREGFWQENNYVGGDEDKLYIDSMDNLKEISHPQADYEINYLDLYESDELIEDGIEVNYPDIDISYAAHLIDLDIDMNKWAYIDKVDKCYDQPWKTTIEINTKLSTIGQQSFTDVLGKIAEVANETKAKQTIYERASAIDSAGNISASKLEGLIQTNKIYLLGGTSNWYTDPKGNIIFEAADGNSAMMLTGRGLMVSNSKDIYGDWDWKTALTGNGFNADVISTGELSAKHIISGTITTDKLSSSVGQELEIGSNKALSLYATIDGTRPAGALKTTDALIEIKAGDDNNPAEINVLSGGEINLKAGVDGGGIMNIESGGELNIDGGILNLTSQGEMNITSGTKLDIQTGSEFTVNSPNFKIIKDNLGNYNAEISGSITATSGKIAGYNIGTNNNVYYMYAGLVQDMSTVANGIYLGTDGINLGGKFTVTNAGALTATDADVSGRISASSGSIGNFTINNSIYSGTKSSIDANTEGVYIGSDGIGLGSHVSQTVQRSKFKVTNAGQMYASDAYLEGTIEATDGHIGGWTINQTSLTSTKTGLASTTNDTDVAIWAGTETRSAPAFYVRQDGYMSATKGSIAGWNIDNVSLTGNKTGIAKTTDDSDIAFWAGNATAANGNFYVRQDGYMKSASGSIAGWTIDSTSLTGNKTGIAKTTADTDIAFWAGNATASSAAFQVTQGGAVTATNATITGSTFTGTVNTGSVIACDISASNITSGTMSANRISGGQIDATDVSIVNLSASNISGGTLTLGGSDNVNGTIVVKNASGTTIGSWTKDGITATSGSFTGTITASANSVIGGWTLGAKNLHSGSGTSYVALSSDTTSNYVMWAGAESPTGNSPAPFRVRRDGTVTINQLKILKSDGVTEQTINLRNVGLWKLAGSTVTSTTASSITLSNGTTVNFKTASDFKIVVSGTNLNISASSGSTPPVSMGIGMDASWASDHTKKVYVTIGGLKTSASATVYASSVYEAGQDSVGFKSTGSWSSGSRTITLTNDKTTTVSIPSTGTWGHVWAGSDSIAVAFNIGGKIFSTTFTRS